MNTQDRAVFLTDATGIEWTIEVPKMAGSYTIGDNFKLFVKTKPRWLSRVLCRALLQWKWEDA